MSEPLLSVSNLRKVFPITLTIVPGPEAKAPSGRSATELIALTPST